MAENISEQSYVIEHQKPPKPEDKGRDRHGCTKTTYQHAEVKVPVKITPYAKVGHIETLCCGDPTLHHRVGEDCNCGDTCELEICQTICIKIPIEYRSFTNVGDYIVNCGKVGNSSKCCDDKHDK